MYSAYSAGEALWHAHVHGEHTHAAGDFAEHRFQEIQEFGAESEPLKLEPETW